MTRLGALTAIGLACAACSVDQDKPHDQTSSAQHAFSCIEGGGGYLRARLRGALVADLDWNNSGMQCDGEPRTDGKGLRVTFAGTLPDTNHQLRFIFGIDAHDIADGAARAMPTNLTVILEGEQQLYATRGSEQCAVETLERTPLEGSEGRMLRVHARGYCVGPATSATGDARLVVPTFEFTGTAAAELEP